MLRKDLLVKALGIGLSVAGMVVTAISDDKKQTKEISKAVEEHLAKK